MKFGAKLTYLATWLGMLAAGSWIVPLMSVAAAPRVAVAAPMSDNSNDDGWTGSEVAQAWALATGSEYAPATQVLTMQSGADQVPVVVDQVRSDDGSSVGLSWFMTELSLPIAETSNQGAEFSVTARAELVTGRVVGAVGHPGYFSAIRLEMRAETVYPSAGSEQSEKFALLPFAAFKAEADAVAFHEAMVEASEGAGGGDGGLFCVNPNWRGFNGVECCMFEAAFNLRVDACRSDYWAAIVACVLAGLGSGALYAQWALGLCRGVCIATPPLCTTCIGLAVVGSIGAAVATFGLCAVGAELLYQGCVSRARADYVTDLGSNGCPPKPGAPQAPPSLGDAGDVDKKSDLLKSDEEAQ
jgi:hypothetical protein